jgi:uncharacterized protein
VSAVAAFAGVTGNLRPVRLRSAAEARRKFGEVPQIEQFFRNGGEEAWAVKSLKALDRVDAVDIVCLDHPTARSITAAAAWCAAHRAFLIADAPAQPSAFGANVALYSPDLVLDDGSTAGASGTMAGVYARMPVWKPPSGREATLAGVRDLSGSVNDSRYINPIRSLPAGGIVAWGARTASDDTDWKYVNVRRLGLYIEESLRRGMQSAGFDPDDLLRGLWRAGALMGNKPQQAFQVSVTETEIIVGFAPLRPAEFVIIRIGGWNQRSTNR